MEICLCERCLQWADKGAFCGFFLAGLYKFPKTAQQISGVEESEVGKSVKNKIFAVEEYKQSF